MVSNLKAETRNTPPEIAAESLGNVGYCRCVEGFIPVRGWLLFGDSVTKVRKSFLALHQAVKKGTSLANWWLLYSIFKQNKVVSCLWRYVNLCPNLSLKLQAEVQVW